LGRRHALSPAPTDRHPDRGSRGAPADDIISSGPVAREMMTGLRILLSLVLFACAGCAAVIVPPKTSPAESVPVLVADYGYHSTIILPKSDGGLVEYAYGDWHYFGQSHKSLGSALHALFASDQATLGRRVLEREINQPGLKEAIGAETILSFRAPRDKVERLERALEQRFSQN